MEEGDDEGCHKFSYGSLLGRRYGRMKAQGKKEEEMFLLLE